MLLWFGRPGSAATNRGLSPLRPEPPAPVRAGPWRHRTVTGLCITERRLGISWQCSGFRWGFRVLGLTTQREPRKMPSVRREQRQRHRTSSGGLGPKRRETELMERSAEDTQPTRPAPRSRWVSRGHGGSASSKRQESPTGEGGRRVEEGPPRREARRRPSTPPGVRGSHRNRLRVRVSPGASDPSPIPTGERKEPEPQEVPTGTAG